MKRGTLITIVAVGLIVVLAGAGIGGWRLYRQSIPREAAYATGRVQNLEPEDGGVQFWIADFKGKEPLNVTVEPGVIVRRREGGAGELRNGQTVSIWATRRGFIVNDAKERFHTADAMFVVIESDGP